MCQKYTKAFEENPQCREEMAEFVKSKYGMGLDELSKSCPENGANFQACVMKAFETIDIEGICKTNDQEIMSELLGNVSNKIFKLNLQTTVVVY